MPSPVSHQQQPPLYQPITIVPEEKEKKPPSGAFLFNDSYHALQLVEHLCIIALGSPIAYASGLIVGSAKAAYQWRITKAPEKLEQDSELHDFGAAAYSRSLTSVTSIIAKRFLSSAFLAHFETLTAPITAIKFPVLRALGYNHSVAWAIQQGFVFKKAVNISEEAVQRFAKWWDVPPK